MIESLVCSAVLSLSAVVGGINRPGTLPAQLAVNDPQHPTIVHIVSRDKTVTVRSGDHGLLYSLSGNDGKTIVADATPEKFAQLQPELYRAIRGYIAVQTDSSAAIPASSAADQPVLADLARD